MARNEQEESEHKRITEKSENKKNQILEFLPSFCLKFRSVGSEIDVAELIFNEPYLQELGYSLDSFVTTVFQEGLPQ